MSQFQEFVNNYPHIAFNDVPNKRTKNHILFQLETFTIRPDSYNLDIVKQYGKVVTWNRKYLEILKSNSIDAEYFYGFPLFDNHYILDEFLEYDSKLDLSLICRYRQNSNIPCDIVNERYNIFMKLQNISKHAYGKIPYCGEFYNGVIGVNENETKPSSLAKFQTMNKYKFNLCLENTYHELWSFDYATEKLFDSMLSKTIPIYLGAYNIQDIVPSHLYIDLRTISVQELNQLILNFPKQRFIDMTEAAYEFVKTFSHYGNVDQIKELTI